MEQLKFVRYRLEQARTSALAGGVESGARDGVLVDQVVHGLRSAPWDRPHLGPAVAALEEVELLAPPCPVTE